MVFINVRLEKKQISGCCIVNVRRRMRLNCLNLSYKIYIINRQAMLYLGTCTLYRTRYSI
jgi:hypothetical protein